MAKVLKEFLRGESAAGVILLAMALLSALIANSSWHATFQAVWHFKFLGMSFDHWINDGLMAVFFLSVGLEIKHELVAGQLSTTKKAALPVAAAVGGMIFPAALYLIFNHSPESRNGWGIPMATDIAFVAGVLSLLGRRVPLALKVFMISLAVVDDIGAVLVIALFYSSDLRMDFLALALLLTGGLVCWGRWVSRSMIWFGLAGALLWWLTLRSGIHASIAGVLLALAIPADVGHQFEKKLRPLVGFLVMPLFALVNAGVAVDLSDFNGPIIWAIFFGLFVGKPVGIVLFSRLASGFRWADLPVGVSWKQIVGAGFLGGIGFTMSLFMAQLSLSSQLATDSATLGIIFASLISGIAGVVILLAEKKAPITGPS